MDDFKIMKHILKKINTLFLSALKIGASPQKIAASFGVGIFIAFSPLIGAHFLMVILSAFVLKLDGAIVLCASLFNNPFTAVPFYSLDYFVGYWILHDILGFDFGWCISLEKIFGMGKICILSFLVGGHIVSLILGIVSYFLVRLLLQKRMMIKLSTNNCTK